MEYAVYRQLSLSLSFLSSRSALLFFFSRAVEHFLKPHRDTRAPEPFDARCYRGYWIKVSRFAEEIISQAARAARAATSPSSLVAQR